MLDYIRLSDTLVKLHNTDIEYSADFASHKIVQDTMKAANDICHKMANMVNPCSTSGDISFSHWHEITEKTSQGTFLMQHNDEFCARGVQDHWL